MKIIYTEDNTKIIDSYLMKNVKEETTKIMRERENKGYLIHRSLSSYIHEVKAHNRLYKLCLFRSHTKDCDLEENIKRWKDIFYRIIWW